MDHPVPLHTSDGPPWRTLIAPAAQHVIVLFFGIVLVPIILVKMYGIPPDEGYRFILMTGLCSAAGTLLQVVRYRQFGLGAPMFMGTSGAFLACAHAAITQGGLDLLANLVFLISPLFFFFGYGLRFIRHIITPTVGGVVIMLAVCGLLKDAIIVWTGDAALDGSVAYIRIFMGSITIMVMILAEWVGGRKYRPWSLALGILSGCIVALAFGEVDLAPIKAAPLIGLPEKIAPSFVFAGTPGHWTALFTFAVAAMVTSIKYAGDVMALDQMIAPGRRTVDYDALQGGLYASFATTALTGLAGGMPPTSHSANIPLMGMTGTTSRRVAVLGALMLMAIVLSPKVTAILLCIPAPVAGAVAVVLVGHLFATGMRLAAGPALSFRDGFIAGLSLCTGLALETDLFFPNAFPAFLHPLMTNGFALGGLVAVGLTLLSGIQTSRGVTFRARARVEELDAVQQGVSNAAVSFSIDRSTLAALELACEEVFVHMVSESERHGYRGDIRFKIRNGDKGIKVDVRCGTRVGDVSIESPAGKRPTDLHELDDAALASLGLVLLGHLAKDIQHIHIDNFAYISFDVARQEGLPAA